MDDIKKDIISLLKEDMNIGRKTIANQFDISESRARKLVKECKDIMLNNESESVEQLYEKLLERQVVIERQNQRYRDTQRIERKIRNKIRVDNALEDYTKALIEILSEDKYKSPTILHEEFNIEKTGVFCLSDLHLNELINLPNNQYDFNIASKRLKKYVIEAKQHFKSQNITKIMIAGLGDFLNSSRRLDEMLNQATNLAKATLLTTFLLEQVILDLNEYFNISILSVSGNESRINDEYGSSDILLSNNHDFTVFEILKIMFKNSDIKFIGSNIAEQVVNINSQNILFLHGNQIGKGDIEKKVMQIKGKYAEQGIIIDYVVFGHIHATYISDNFARSSSLCGANAYSNNDLQLSSRAAQLLLIVTCDEINAIKIDLQKTFLNGYDIDKSLESYATKSIHKYQSFNIESV